MRSIEILADEHRLIRAALSRLEHWIQDTQETGAVDALVALELVHFFEHFADGLHQEREESCLLPLLERRAARSEVAHVRRILADHQRERALLDTLRGELEGACYGDLPSLDRFVVAGRSYVRLQRSHMGRETVVLLPLAERVLDDADDDLLCREFEELDGAFVPPRRERVQHVLARIGADPMQLEGPFELYPFL